MDRISRDTMFMEIAHTLARRSTCTRAQVGAVLVRDNRIISTGYAGAPSGMAHCLDIGCDVNTNLPEKDQHCMRTVHAEANVIAFAARYGIKTDGATLYCTHRPCENCAKLLINAGIKEVIYLANYGATSGLDLLTLAGINVRSFTNIIPARGELHGD